MRLWVVLRASLVALSVVLFVLLSRDCGRGGGVDYIDKVRSIHPNPDGDKAVVFFRRNGGATVPYHDGVAIVTWPKDLSIGEDLPSTVNL